MQPFPTPEAIDAAAGELAQRWRWILAAGIAGIVFGLILLINPFSTAVALAWLIGIALVFNGVGEVSEAGRYEVRWPSYVVGAIWILTGAVAVAWPGLTLLVLARVIGIGFILGAIAQIGAALTFFSHIPHRGLIWFAAVLNLLGGILVLAWPTVTVVVLAMLIGLRVLFQGVAATYFAWSIRRFA